MLYSDLKEFGERFAGLQRQEFDGDAFHEVADDAATHVAEANSRSDRRTDVDVDGSGTMYLAAWDGAGFRGNPDKGYVVRVVPTDWTYEVYPDLKALERLFNGLLLIPPLTLPQTSSK